MKPRSIGSALTAMVAASVLAACGTTTVVEVSTVPTTVVNETTTLPRGTPAQLALRLSELAYTLGTAIIDGNGKQTFGSIEAIWDSLSSALPRTEFMVKLGERIEFMRNAVERKRPADADKAALHIGALIAAAQGELAAA